MSNLSRQRLLAALSLALLGAAAISMAASSRRLLVSTVVASCALAAWGLTCPGPGAAVATLVAAISCASLAGLRRQAVMLLAMLSFAVAAKLSPELGVVRQVVGRVPVWSTIVCAAVTPVALGVLRQQAGGLLAPVLAHVVADSTIAYLVISMAALSGAARISATLWHN